MNTIKLDGIDYTDDCLELQDIDSFTYQLDDDSSIVTKSISSDLTFIGEARDLILQSFFDDTTADCKTIIQVEITLGCCVEGSFIYQITHESVTDCPEDCSVSVTLVKLNEDNIAYEYLRRTRVFDGLALFNITKPHLEYCTGSGFKSAGAILFQIVNIIFGSINIVIGIINALPGVNIQLLGTEIIDDLLGCDRLAPGFVAREAIEYHAGEAGLEFQSETIFDIPNYHNSTVIATPYRDGRKACPAVNVLVENRPNMNIIDFIGTLKPLFAAEARVKNGTLYFETEKWFEDNLVRVAGVEDLIFDSDEGGICYQYDLDIKYASYGRFEYSYDPVDQWGGYVADVYNDIVEWNPDGNVNQKGEFTNIADAFSPLFIIPMKAVDLTNPVVQLTGHGVIYEGISAKWKIFAWDGGALCKSRAVRTPSGNPFSLGGGGHNYPFWFKQGLADDPNNFYPGGSLYDNFHYYKDPANRPCPMSVPDFTFAVDDFCDMLAQIEEHGIDIYIECPFGKITPTVIDVNISDNTFTWQGCRIIRT